MSKSSIGQPTSPSRETILITGGTGFAGSHLVQELQTAGSNQIHVTSYGSSNSYVSTLLNPDQIHQLDLTNHKKTLELLQTVRPTQIYHLASIAGVGSSFQQVKKTVAVNFEIQLSLLSAMVEACPKARLLTIGSALEYQPQNKPLQETDQLGPVNPYGVSKVLQEMLAHQFSVQHQLEVVKVRPFNHIGERQALGFVVPDFATQIAKIEQGKQTKIEVGNLQAVRDLSDVKDIVFGYRLLMERGAVGQVYNIGQGHGYQIQQVLDKLIELAEVKIRVEVDPRKFRPIDVPQVVADNSKIKRLGWHPHFTLDQTLERVLAYYREQVSSENSKDIAT